MKNKYINSYVKRILDITLSVPLMAISLPIVAAASLLIFLNDFQFPIYLSQRVGKSGNLFTLFKIRTMQVNADRVSTYTTIDNDKRLITAGKILRKIKIDELPQFLNILLNDISLVGPRPNVPKEVERYNDWEKSLLQYKPGITDMSSIVFFDLGAIIPKDLDPNVSYEIIIRPWKNKLAVWYCENASLLVDLMIIFLTATTFISKKWSTKIIVRMIEVVNFDKELIAYLNNSINLKKFQ